MNYGGGGQDHSRYGGGGAHTDHHGGGGHSYGDYDGEKGYYQSHTHNQLPSFPFSNLRHPPAPIHLAYHHGASDRVLPPMSSVARGTSNSATSSSTEHAVDALSAAAAAAHQISRLGSESSGYGHMKSSLYGSGGGSSMPSYMQQQGQQQQGTSAGSSASGHSDRLYGGSAFSGASHSGGSSHLLTESKPGSSPRSRGSGDDGHYGGLPSLGGSSSSSAMGGRALPPPSDRTNHLAQLAATAATQQHQTGASLSHITNQTGSPHLGGGGSHQSTSPSTSSTHDRPMSSASSSSAASSSTSGGGPRTAASLNPKDLLELYSKWDQIDTKTRRTRTKSDEAQAEEVRKERHNMAEKRRRSDMNVAIDRLKSLLPQQVTNDRRLTKVEVLTEAADHLTQVQNLCAKLITENKRLKTLSGMKLEDDDFIKDAEDGIVGEDERRRSDDDGSSTRDDGPSRNENDEPERESKRQRRESPGDNSDGNGNGGRDEESELASERAHSSNDLRTSQSSLPAARSRGLDREEVEGVEGRDSDNSNDGLTTKERMASSSTEPHRGEIDPTSGMNRNEPTSFAAVSFPPSNDEMNRRPIQHQLQQHGLHGGHHRHHGM